MWNGRPSQGGSALPQERTRRRPPSRHRPQDPVEKSRNPTQQWGALHGHNLAKDYLIDISCQHTERNIRYQVYSHLL